MSRVGAMKFWPVCFLSLFRSGVNTRQGKIRFLIRFLRRINGLWFLEIPGLIVRFSGHTGIRVTRWFKVSLLFESWFVKNIFELVGLEEALLCN